MKGFSTITSKESLDEVSQRIRGAMQERGKQRRRASTEEGSWDVVDTSSGGTGTPEGLDGPREGKKDA